MDGFPGSTAVAVVKTTKNLPDEESNCTVVVVVEKQVHLKIFINMLSCKRNNSRRRQRLTIDQQKTIHRPLIWNFCECGFDLCLVWVNDI